MDDGEKEVPTFPWEEKLLKKALRKLKKERALREQQGVNTKYEGESNLYNVTVHVNVKFEVLCHRCVFNQNPPMDFKTHGRVLKTQGR